MTALLALLTAAVLCGGARLVARHADRHAARRAAVATAGAAVALAVGHAAWAAHTAAAPGRDPSHAALLLTAACVGGLLAVALAPVADHPPPVLRRCLELTAVAAATPAAPAWWWAVPCWAAAAGLMWTALRADADTAGTARLFAVHQAPGVAAFAAGAACAAAGQDAAAAVLLGLAVLARVAAPPLHVWLPALTQRAPVGLTVAFAAATWAGTLTLPATAPPGAGWTVLAVAGALWAAALGAVQPDALRAVGYLMASQGAVTVAAWAGGPGGRWAAVVAGATATVAGGGLAMALAAARARRGPLLLSAPGGHLGRTPRLAAAVLWCGLAATGFPPLLGFVGQELVRGTLHAHAAALAVGAVAVAAVNAVTVLRCHLLLFGGVRRHQGERDLTAREVWAVTAAGVALLAAGSVPAVLRGPDPSGAQPNPVPATAPRRAGQAHAGTPAPGGTAGGRAWTRPTASGRTAGRPGVGAPRWHWRPATRRAPTRVRPTRRCAGRARPATGAAASGRAPAPRYRP